MEKGYFVSPSIHARDVLIPTDYERFERTWEGFKEKGVPSEPWEVHMGVPYIGRVMQFEDKPIFRAKVLQKRDHLRSLNPYNNHPFYNQPNWHIVHYWMAGEQIYHASMELVRPNNNRCFTRDAPGSSKFNHPIKWSSKTQGNISITMFYSILKGGWERGICQEYMSAEYVDDKEGESICSISGLGMMQNRSYVRVYKAMKSGHEWAREKMIRMIENQDVNLSRLTPMRKHMTTNSSILMGKISHGELPKEEELDDFFSFYDRDWRRPLHSMSHISLELERRVATLETYTLAKPSVLVSSRQSEESRDSTVPCNDLSQNLSLAIA